MIAATASLCAKVAPQIARSGDGSTAYNKRYPGGSAAFVIANSAAALRSMTKKRVVKDEASEYPADLESQGSPHAMIEARRTAFLAGGEWKETNISTPTVKGDCYISGEFQAGDQRFWHVDCPGCGLPFYFKFGPHFRFNDAFPFQAYYISPCCGTVIEGNAKNALVRAGSSHAPRNDYLESLGLHNGWIAQSPAPGKSPSYHFDALSSPFVPWDYIAEKWVDAKTDPAKLKGFYNLTLGEAYEMKGDAPDHALLMQRREDYPAARIPPGALLLTVAADVQMRGIYVEVLAHAPDRQTWVVLADYLDGATTDVDQGAFAALTDVYNRTWDDGYGNAWRHDEFGVDAGYRSDVVYEWTRRHPGSKALKGTDGWGRVPLGLAADVDVDYRGRRIKGGAKIRAVGTWPLKSTFYTYLALEPIADNSALVYPPGFCHFGRFLDENYFRQITAEYLEEETYRGRTRKVWKVGSHRDNHFLDCRIYNLALANAYTSTFTADDWARLAKERGIPEDRRAPDLFAPRAFSSTPVAQPPQPAGPDQFARLAEMNKDT
jgi:phage terminase large subunit GpA-like protein